MGTKKEMGEEKNRLFKRGAVSVDELNTSLNV